MLLHAAQPVEIRHRRRIGPAAITERTQPGYTLGHQAGQHAKRLPKITGIQRLPMQQRLIAATNQLDRPVLQPARADKTPAQAVIRRQPPGQRPHIVRYTAGRDQPRGDDMQRLTERRGQLANHQVLQIQRGDLVQIAQRQHRQRRRHRPRLARHIELDHGTGEPITLAVNRRNVALVLLEQLAQGVDTTG
ncbi:hypothetical protein D3C76_1247820 [compost metagenome]